MAEEEAGEWALGQRLPPEESQYPGGGGEDAPATAEQPAASGAPAATWRFEPTAAATAQQAGQEGEAEESLAELPEWRSEDAMPTPLRERLESASEMERLDESGP